MLLSIGVLQAQSDANENKTEFTIEVQGLCGSCTNRIETAALKTEGVKRAKYDVDSNLLTVKTKSDFNIKTLHRNIAFVGHDTNMYDALDEAYESLPGCCRYRDISREESEVLMSGKNIEKSDEPTEQKIESNISVSNNNSPQTIEVKGLCGSCTARIETAAMKTEGVTKANYDVVKNLLTVDTNSDFDIKTLHRNIALVGHDTNMYDALDEVYESLPGCCQYRDITKEESEALMSGTSVEDLNENHEGHNHEELGHENHEGHNHGEETSDHKYEITKVQNSLIEGYVFEINNKGKQVPLIGVNIMWLDSNEGSSTDLDGYFSIKESGENNTLVFSYVGYQTDTITVNTKEYVELVMSNSVMLDAVNVVYKKKSTSLSRIDPIKVQSITAKELCKAACCNLSESFETNPTVDSGITDAVTGTRKIEMLGLAGPNVQILRENMPDIRGLSAIYGLSYIPGPWISGIQLNTGTGSVVNGFESITGQINVEMKKPENSERFYANVFTNSGGRLETNLNAKFKISDNVSTGILAHGKMANNIIDSNSDGFLDNPLERDYILANRWHYNDDNGWSGQFGIKLNKLNHTSGQLSQFIAGQGAHNNQGNSGLGWKSEVGTDRYEAWWKSGKVFSKKKYQSIGLQLSGVYHDQQALFGTRRYDAVQKSLYGNLIFQTQIAGKDEYGLKLGSSIQYDNFNENFIGTNYKREEIVPGAFSEFTYILENKIAIVLGLRGDYHNNYGLFVTPRLHSRFTVTENDVIRVTAGSALRTASVFAENIGVLASNRNVFLRGNNEGNPYGLNPETSWNYGINYTKYIDINQKEMVIAIDYYRTEFTDQVVIDWDKNIHDLHIYNLEGQSFSNSIQAQIDYELLKNFDIRLAYRFNDVQTDYEEGLLTKPFTSRHRAFANFGYATEKSLEFDLTVNWVGESRLVDTSNSPEAFQREAYSPDYFLLNGQISKTWNGVFDWYLGSENILNFVQFDPIISADNPSNPFFDSTMIWGPVFGRMVYSGIRYRFE